MLVFLDRASRFTVVASPCCTSGETLTERIGGIQQLHHDRLVVDASFAGARDNVSDFVSNPLRRFRSGASIRPARRLFSRVVRDVGHGASSSSLPDQSLRLRDLDGPP